MTPYQISLEIFGGFYYSGITLNESDPAVVAPTIAESHLHHQKNFSNQGKPGLNQTRQLKPLII